MRATQIILSDMKAYQDKLVNGTFEEKVKAFYENSVRVPNDDINTLLDVETTKKALAIFLKVLKSEHIDFCVQTYPVILGFFKNDEDIIWYDEIDIPNSEKYQYTDDEDTLKNIFIEILKNKKVSLYSLYVLKTYEGKQSMGVRYKEIHREYIDARNFDFSSVEMLPDDYGVDKSKYGKDVSDMGDYFIQRTRQKIMEHGYTDIIHDETKYKEINENE